MKTTLITIILTCAGVLSLSAQDVNGVEFGDRMTYDQVVSLFGEPTEYKERDSGDDGVNQYYYYRKNQLHFKDNIFESFIIYDSSFVSLEKHIEGGIRVGVPVSRLDDFKGGTLEKDERFQNCYNLWLDDSDLWLSLKVVDGIITCIYGHDLY